MGTSRTTSLSSLDPRLAAVALLDVRTVARLLGISLRHVWRLSAIAEAGQGDFPRPLRLGPKTIRWRLQDVEKYIEAVAAEQR